MSIKRMDLLSNLLNEDNKSKERYTFLFRYIGSDDVAYATTASNIAQALIQIKKANPQKAESIDAYYRNGGLKITKKPYVPKEEPPKPKKKEMSQLTFKGFTDQPSWPDL